MQHIIFPRSCSSDKWTMLQKALCCIQQWLHLYEGHTIFFDIQQWECIQLCVKWETILYVRLYSFHQTTTLLLYNLLHLLTMLVLLSVDEYLKLIHSYVFSITVMVKAHPNFNVIAHFLAQCGSEPWSTTITASAPTCTPLWVPQRVIKVPLVFPCSNVRWLTKILLSHKWRCSWTRIRGTGAVAAGALEMSELFSPMQWATTSEHLDWVTDLKCNMLPVLMLSSDIDAAYYISTLLYTAMITSLSRSLTFLWHLMRIRIYAYNCINVRLYYM